MRQFDGFVFEPWFGEEGRWVGRGYAKSSDVVVQSALLAAFLGSVFKFL